MPKRVRKILQVKGNFRPQEIADAGRLGEARRGYIIRPQQCMSVRATRQQHRFFPPPRGPAGPGSQQTRRHSNPGGGALLLTPPATNRCQHANWPSDIRSETHLPSGQLSKTCCAISPADSLGLNRNSLVLPLTRMSRRLICKNTKKCFRRRL
jgi:hypothetical protein